MRRLKGTKQMNDMVRCTHICKPLWLLSGALTGREQREKVVTSLEVTKPTRQKMKEAWQKMAAA